MTVRRISFLISLWLVFVLASVYAVSAGSLYSKAISAAKSAKYDIAYLHFSKILDKYSGSPYTENALFGAAEYYYSISDYRDARKLLEQFAANYPKSKAKLFALAYLYKLSKESQRDEAAKELRKEIITFKQQSFLFRVFKNYQYRSPLNKLYKAVYYIDRAEFYIDETLFAKIDF